jgi:GrpB-like predicted nucleotidyltransferase (UPF0157 family)
MSKRVVELMPYTPMYKEFYLKECKVLEKVLRSNCIDIHHIGSTSIPKILSKPTLDVLCVVHTLDGIEVFKDEFEKFGLEWRGEHGIPGRLYFVRKAQDGVTHLSHIHIFEKGNELINDHLDFRDYLNAEEAIAKEYDKLKVELKEKFSDDPSAYQKGKAQFIEMVLKSIN